MRLGTGRAVLPVRRFVALIVEPAHPARIAPLLMSAYGLTENGKPLREGPMHPGWPGEAG